MPSVDELAADDPYDVEAATRAAKKMTSNQLRDRLTAAAADAPSLIDATLANAKSMRGRTTSQCDFPPTRKRMDCNFGCAILAPPTDEDEPGVRYT